MKRFYVSPEHIRENKIYITGKEAHHIKDVLRLKKGSAIAAFDGKGKEYKGMIAEMRSNEVVVAVNSSRFTLAKDAPYEVTLAQAVSKNTKIDLVVQKATELGVDKIVLLNAHRSIIKLDCQGVVAKDNLSPHTSNRWRLGTNLRSKFERWQRIAEQASKQCGRSTVPLIGDYVSLKDALGLLKDSDLKLFFCIHKQTVKLSDVLSGFKEPPKQIAVFIGPEGDFTEDEIAQGKENSYNLVSLGERVLRTETAGLYVLSVLDYVFGDRFIGIPTQKHKPVPAKYHEDL